MGSIFSSTTSSASSSPLSSAYPSTDSIDCQLGSWVSVGVCNVSCGGGFISQTRQITQQASENGIQCPSVDQLTQKMPCNTQPCPINCSLSLWTDDECSVPCGGGTRRQTRSILIQNAFGGEPCASLTQNVSCNVQPCSIDCVTGAWKDITTCSASCGIGVISRTLPILTQPAYGGKLCPTNLSQNVPCIMRPCPIDCVTGEWTDTTECSVKCGGGIKKQILPVISPNAYGGTCPNLTREIACNIDRCPVDCVTGPWIDNSECSASCGDGVKTQTLSIITPAAYGGKACPTTLTQTVPCNKTPCRSDCVLSAWTDSTECSVKCGSGTKTQTATVITPAGHGGTCPTELTKTVTCNTQSCPVDCVLGDWIDSTECNLPCGGGKKTQILPILTRDENKGNACPVSASLIRTVSCNTQHCPVDCVTGSWMDLTSCSVECGGGTKKQSLSVVSPAAYGGTCPDLTRSVDCNTQNCPVDCVVGPWTDIMPCNVSCGGGTKTQTMTLITEASYGGKACPTQLTQNVSCNMQPCPVNCITGSWTDLTTCNVECGNGTKKQSLTVVSPAAYGGTCPELTRSVDCNMQNCRVDCVTGSWSDSGPCSVQCGGGTKPQTLSVITEAANGGKACPVLTQSVACNQQPCPIDCVTGNWTDTSECSVKCGGGTKTQILPIVSPPAYGGTCSSNLSKTLACNSQPCPVDCVTGTWSDSGPCTVQCGGGTKPQTLSVITEAANGGKACPTLTQSVACNSQPCPVDCVTGAWTDTSPCSVTCGGGTKTQTLPILTPATYGGTCSTNRTKTIACNSQPCPVDCVTGTWSDSGPCSVQCGGGTKPQTLSVITEAANGGKACPTLTQSVPCNPQPCPMDCVTGPWTDTSQCTVTCGGGTKTQSLPIISLPAYGGKACTTSVSQTVACNTQGCPIDCVLGSWLEPGPCSVPCGGGTKDQKMSVITQDANGGIPCPVNLCQTLPCNTQHCPVDCVMGPWIDTSYCSVQCGDSLGVKTQITNVVTSPAYNGKACPIQRTQTVQCSTSRKCPVNYLIGVAMIVIDGMANCNDLPVTNMIVNHDANRCAVGGNKIDSRGFGHTTGLGVTNMMVYDKYDIAVVKNKNSPNMLFTDENPGGGCGFARHVYKLNTPTDVSKFVIAFSNHNTNLVAIQCYNIDRVLVYSSKKIFITCYQQNIYVFDFSTNVPNYLVTPLLVSNTFTGELSEDIISSIEKSSINPSDTSTPADLKCFDSCAVNPDCKGIIINNNTCIQLSNITNIAPVLPSSSFNDLTNASLIPSSRRNFYNLSTDISDWTQNNIRPVTDISQPALTFAPGPPTNTFTVAPHV